MLVVHSAWILHYLRSPHSRFVDKNVLDYVGLAVTSCAIWLKQIRPFLLSDPFRFFRPCITRVLAHSVLRSKLFLLFSNMSPRLFLHPASENRLAPITCSNLARRDSSVIVWLRLLQRPAGEDAACSLRVGRRWSRPFSLVAVSNLD